MNMKKIVLALFALVAISVSAYAVVPSAATGKIDYSVTNVSTSAFTQVIPAASVKKAIKGISVYNNAPNPVLIGFGSSGSEVAQIMVTGSLSTTYFPIVAAQNTRISVKASTGTNSSGEIQVNAFYN